MEELRLCVAMFYLICSLCLVLNVWTPFLKIYFERKFGLVCARAQSVQACGREVGAATTTGQGRLSCRHHHYLPSRTFELPPPPLSSVAVDFLSSFLLLLPPLTHSFYCSGVFRRLFRCRCSHGRPLGRVRA
ncbi:metallothionein-like protein type 2 [Iris pallida]|uniref:Metallothionein-like protein type 2 n=1 Tax=Iris pallida TaxID=29817 RepID=A0AAX6GD86_IRIPA|nr:metallothionein-like protein type 2 [Iris pallida]